MRSCMSRKGGVLIYLLFLSVLTPPTVSFVKDKFIRIVVQANKAWLLKPEIIYDSMSAGEIHHFIVKLKYGKNKIKVFYEKNGETKSKDLIVYSFPSKNFRVRARLYTFHNTKISKMCEDCHSIEFKSVSEKEDLDCYTCHKEKFDKTLKLNPPFEELSCKDCHEKIFDRPKSDACEICHELESGFYLHSPYAKGECMICHDPHSSKENKFLKDKINNLCYLCHDKKGYKVHHPVASHPGERKGIYCTNCHNPHGTRYGFHLKWPNKPVCLVCHKK